MATSKAQNTIQSAVEFGFLTKSQLETIDKDRSKSNASATEIAIRHGFLNRQQLDILNVFSNPFDAVPGYRIDGLIGQGGAGVVYKATQVRMDRPVAIKTIKQVSVRNESAPKRFEREARIVGKLRHPNIISAFDFGVHGGQLYLVMEYIEGINAEEHLDRHGNLAEDHAWHVALQAAHALDYASQNGITHRDIKPANLILTTPPRGTQLPPNVPFVKIADFGLARFRDKQASPSITVEGSINGTPYYMPPEQVTSSDVDHLSDIYAMGISLWHLITGQPPFSGAGPMDVISNKMKIEDEWLEDPPAGISSPGFELLKKMSRHHREDRISSYDQLIAQIKSVISDLPVPNENNPAADQRPLSVAPNVTFFDSLSGYCGTDDADSDFRSDFDSSEMGTLGSPTEPVSSVPTRQKWIVWVAGAAMVAAGAWGISNQFFNRDATTSETATQAETRIRLDSFAGPPIFLFNGTDVDPRQKFSGLWEPARGGEGESVLAGKNGARDFPCADENGDPLQWFRFSCGFRHHESNRIEFRWLESDQTEAFRVAITPEESKLFVGESEVANSQLEKFGEDSFGYHTFQIESQPDHWRVMVNATLIGLVDKSDRPDGVPVIQLTAAGAGSGHFEQIQLFRFSQEDANTDLE